MHCLYKELDFCACVVVRGGEDGVTFRTAAGVVLNSGLRLTDPSYVFYQLWCLISVFHQQ